MKKNKNVVILISLLLVISYVLLTIVITNKNKELKVLEKNLVEENIENDNLEHAFKSLLEIDPIDSVHRKSQIEIGVWFRKEGCFDCNFMCIQMLKRKIPSKYLCLYPNTYDSEYLNLLKVRNLRVKYFNISNYFHSTQPVIFVTLEGKIIFKFYPNKDYPAVTKIYIEKISKMIE